MNAAPKVGDASPLLFYKPPRRGVFDNVLHYADGTFFLYYQDGLPGPGYGLSTSTDGVNWTYQGTVYDAPENGLVTASGGSPIWTATIDGERKYLMQTASHAPDEDVVAFLESDDLYRWKLNKRVDLWLGQVIARKSGGFEAFGEGGRDENGDFRFGSAESADGLTWRSRDPVALVGLQLSPTELKAVELGGVIERNGTYYFLAGLNDLEHLVVDGDPTLTPGCTTLVADSPAGPARPASKNRHLMVTNNSYFLRFSVFPDEVLVNHFSYEANPANTWGFDSERTYIAPFKRAEWDHEGTLRLTYWPGNDRAKTTPVEASIPEDWSQTGIGMLAHAFDTEETSMVEGRVSTSSRQPGERIGLYIEDRDGVGSAFAIRDDGAVEYGSLHESGQIRFSGIGVADREISLGESTSFRLIRRRKMTEFYIDDYLMVCFELPSTGTGRIGLLGRRPYFSESKAWYCRG